MIEPRVLAREEAVVVERDVGAGAADDEVLAAEREALAVGAVRAGGAPSPRSWPYNAPPPSPRRAVSPEQPMPPRL